MMNSEAEQTPILFALMILYSMILSRVSEWSCLLRESSYTPVSSR